MRPVCCYCCFCCVMMIGAAATTWYLLLRWYLTSYTPSRFGQMDGGKVSVPEPPLGT